jgi:hypothetical protein
MRTSPTAAIVVLLELPPVHLQLEAEAKARVYRLNCNDQWKSKLEGFGHACMTQEHNERIQPRMGTDKITPGYAYDKSFSQVP